MTSNTPLDIDPAILARFGRLEWIARLVVEGVMAGRHRSPFKGFSVEFAEHRQYGPGDEIRHIDWRALGKTDRYFVKEYEEETNLQVHLVVDTSASMGYRGATTASKFEHARQVAASLAYLMIGQRDAVGLATLDPDGRADLPPRSAPGHFAKLCQSLEAAHVGGEAPVSGLLHALAGRIKRRGLVAILSDGFDRLDDLVAALRHLRHRRHEVAFFHVLAPEEETFPFRRPGRFRNLEVPGSSLRVNPAAVRSLYLERFAQFRRELEAAIRGMGGEYHKALTATPLDQTLLDYLAGRSGRARSPGW